MSFCRWRFLPKKPSATASGIPERLDDRHVPRLSKRVFLLLQDFMVFEPSPQFGRNFFTVFRPCRCPFPAFAHRSHATESLGLYTANAWCHAAFTKSDARTRAVEASNMLLRAV